MKHNNNLFYNNISLFLSNKDYILSDSSLYMTLVELPTFGVLGLKFSKMPLGAWLELWTTNPELFDNCRCGGKAAVVSFGGSVYSGRHQRISVCLSCGKFIKRTDGSLSNYSKPFATIYKKYIELPKCNTLSFNVLIDKLVERKI